MASDMVGITSSVISATASSPLSLTLSLVMLVIIVVLATYLLYRHHKRKQGQAGEAQHAT